MLLPDLDFLTGLSAGGDVAMLIVVYIMWRLDRRLVGLETAFRLMKGKSNG